MVTSGRSMAPGSWWTSALSPPMFFTRCDVQPAQHNSPLVTCCEVENHHLEERYINQLFLCAMFNSYVANYQRVYIHHIFHIYSIYIPYIFHIYSIYIPYLTGRITRGLLFVDKRNHPKKRVRSADLWESGPRSPSQKTASPHNTVTVRVSSSINI